MAPPATEHKQIGSRLSQITITARSTPTYPGGQGVRTTIAHVPALAAANLRGHATCVLRVCAACRRGVPVLFVQLQDAATPAYTVIDDSGGLGEGEALPY
eukprot:2540466-Prymnesium_polylepis.1